MRTLVWVRLGLDVIVDGPPGAVVGTASPKSIARAGRGAGAAGAATEVSAEKSIESPPNALLSVFIVLIVPREAYSPGVSGRGSRGRSKVAELGQDRFAHELDLAGLPDVVVADDDVLGAGVRELAVGLDEGARVVPTGPAGDLEVRVDEDAPLDLVVRPPHGFAVPLENFPLAMRPLGPERAADVRRVAVL